MAKYLSKEWLELGRNAINSNEEFMSWSRPHGFSASFLHSVIGVDPLGHTQTLYYWSRFDNGKCAEVGLGKIENTDFEFEAAYNVWVRIHKGAMGIIPAVLTRKLKMKGSLLKAVKYRKMAGLMRRVIAEVETEY
jgi:hypothetical protein